MNLSGLDRFVWAATFYGYVLLLIVLFVRRRARSFPAFTTYIAESIVTNVIFYFVLHHLSIVAYRNFYWGLGILDEIIQLFVFYELAVQVFRPTGVWARDVRKTFLGVVGASAMVALLLAWLSHPMSKSPIQIFILRSNFFSATLMSELFVGMVILSSSAGLPWKTHVAKIAQGFGAYSMVCIARDIVTNYMNVNQHLQLYRELSQALILTYLACELFWIGTLWREAPAPRELPEAMRMQIYSLQRQLEYDLQRIRRWRKK